MMGWVWVVLDSGPQSAPHHTHGATARTVDWHDWHDGTVVKREWETKPIGLVLPGRPAAQRRCRFHVASGGRRGPVIRWARSCGMLQVTGGEATRYFSLVCVCVVPEKGLPF